MIVVSRVVVTRRDRRVVVALFISVNNNVVRVMAEENYDAS